MEATLTNPTLEAIERELKEAKEGWENGVFSSIICLMKFGAPQKKFGQKPSWSSWQAEKHYTDLLELACKALESSSGNGWIEQIQDILEDHFEGNFCFLPPKIRELVVMNFPFFISP